MKLWRRRRKCRSKCLKDLPFSVDTWTPSSKISKRHHFLTHAHKDHSSNIISNSSFPIYSTLLTKTLLLQHYPKVNSFNSSIKLPFSPFIVSQFSYLNFCFCSLILPFFCKLKLVNPSSSMILMETSLSPLSMPITVLVIISINLYTCLCILCLIEFVYFSIKRRQ
jgi:hypothetical protein